MRKAWVCAIALFCFFSSQDSFGQACESDVQRASQCLQSLEGQLNNAVPGLFLSAFMSQNIITQEVEPISPWSGVPRARNPSRQLRETSLPITNPD